MQVFILPTIRINGVQYRGKMATTEVLGAICAGFTAGNRPAACSKVMAVHAFLFWGGGGLVGRGSGDDDDDDEVAMVMPLCWELTHAPRPRPRRPLLPAAACRLWTTRACRAARATRSARPAPTARRRRAVQWLQPLYGGAVNGWGEGTTRLDLAW